MEDWLGVLVRAVALMTAMSPITAPMDKQQASVTDRVLIVADELPAMEVLAEHLRSLEDLQCDLVAQDSLPQSLAKLRAVIVYIHGRLDPHAESALLRYAEDGGRLILLHHSISSGKRANREWFRKLGVELPPGEVENGGYKWIEGVTLEVCNLAQRHFITNHRMTYPAQVPFTDRRGNVTSRPGMVFPHSEVYIHHRLTGDRTTLLGYRYVDAASGKTWTEPTAGWVRRLGKGHVVYFMPGHTAEEFRNEAYARLIANAVIWDP